MKKVDHLEQLCKQMDAWTKTHHNHVFYQCGQKLVHFGFHSVHVVHTRYGPAFIQITLKGSVMNFAVSHISS